MSQKITFRLAFANKPQPIKVFTKNFYIIKKNKYFMIDNESKKITIKGGYYSQWFINDYDNNRTIYEKPWIVISLDNLNESKNITDFLNFAAQKKYETILIAPHISDEVISLLAANKLQGMLKVCPAKIPVFFGDKAIDYLRNLIKELNAISIKNEIKNFTLDLYIAKLKKAIISQEECEIFY